MPSHLKYLTLVLTVCSFFLMSAAKVVRYDPSASSKPAATKDTPAAKETPPPPEIDFNNPQHVESLLKRIKLTDIRYYQKLMQAKQTNYIGMVDHLKKYWEDFNPDTLNQTKLKLNQRQKELSLKLTQLADLYKKSLITRQNTDALHREFKTVAVEICKTELDMLELQQKFSRLETARLETQYDLSKSRIQENVEHLFQQHDVPLDLYKTP